MNLLRISSISLHWSLDFLIMIETKALSFSLLVCTIYISPSKNLPSILCSEGNLNLTSVAVQVLESNYSLVYSNVPKVPRVTVSFQNCLVSRLLPLL